MTDRSMSATLRGILTRLQSVERRLALIPLANLADGTLASAGDVKVTARSGPPSGWLLANGAALDRADYAALFAAIGTAYNTGGETALQFRLPNLKGRVPVGLDAVQTEFNALGRAGGSKTHVLSVTELPAQVPAIVTPAPGAYYWNANTGQGERANPGGGGAHNNLQPYIVLNYIIKT